MAILNLVRDERNTVFLATRKSRLLQVLAFDEKSTFDFFALFRHIKRASLFMPQNSQ
jgi:hypothetical protein